MKHTPGPWKISYMVETSDSSQEPNAYSYVINHGDIELEQHKANATLISAAPDMLEVLISIAHDPGCPEHVVACIADVVDKATGKEK